MKPYIKIIPNTWMGKDYQKGWGNGYVVLPKDHPFYGLDYDFVSSFVNVHCGLTYGSHEDNGHDGWCFGFDTMHLRDTAEEWTYQAVKEHTLNLLDQFVELGNKYTKEDVLNMLKDEEDLNAFESESFE